MAQDKRVFTGGMDKDSEPRLIKQGDYRDAKNIRNIASSDGTSGSVENIEGTQETNYNFIEESETIIETLDEQVIQVTQTFQYKDIIISSKENDGFNYNFRIFNLDAGGNPISEVYSGGLFWSGGSTQKNTATKLHHLFNSENGEASQNIPLLGINTSSGGTTPITGRSELYYMGSTYNSNITELASGDEALDGGRILVLRIISNVADVVFNLDFMHEGQDTNDYWSDTLDGSLYDYGNLNITQGSSGLRLGSASGFNTDTVEVLLGDEILSDTIENDDGVPIGDVNVFTGNANITEVQMTISGLNPLTPQDPLNEFKMFSVVENENGTVQAIPFAVDQFSLFESDFNSGDPFEFDGDQTEIAASLIDKLSIPFSTQIIVPGNSSAVTHTISTANQNVATNFTANTALGVVRSANISASASASDFLVMESYDSLSSFDYGRSGSNFIDSNTSVAILNDSITIASPSRGGAFNREVFFPVPSTGIVKGETYRIEANISTFTSSGNSITFQTQDGENISPAVTSTDSSFSFQFEAEENNQSFKVVVSNGFAEQDVIVMSGVSIRQFQTPIPDLIVEFRASYDFDLVFGTDAATVVSAYQEGTQQTSLEWFSGVTVNLNQNIIYGQSYDDITTIDEGYSDQIAELESTIASLQSQLTSLTTEYNATVVSLNAALNLDSADAVGSYNLINNDLSNLTEAITQNDEELQSIFATLDAAYADGAASVTPEDGISQADVDAAEASAAEAAAELANLQNELEQAQANLENANATVVNAVGQNLITNGDFTSVGSLLDGSLGWKLYDGDNSFGAALATGEDMAILDNGNGNGFLRLRRESDASTDEVTSVAAWNTTADSSEITESSKNYRLQFDVVSSTTVGGHPSSSVLQYYDGSDWIDLGTVSHLQDANKVIFYTATGTTFAIRLKINNRILDLDNFNLQQISTDTLEDFNNLNNDLEAATNQLTSIQNSISAAASDFTGGTALLSVESLVNAYSVASESVTTLTGQIGSLITSLNGASFSDINLTESVDVQILELETAIQALVALDASIAGDDGFASVTEFQTAVTNLYSSSTDLIALHTDLNSIASNIFDIIPSTLEGYSDISVDEEGGVAGLYDVSGLSQESSYVQYHAVLQQIVNQYQTLLTDANALSNANVGLQSDLAQQVQESIDAADAQQIIFDAALAVAQDEARAALEAQQLAEADLAAAITAHAASVTAAQQAEYDAATGSLQDTINENNATIASNTSTIDLNQFAIDLGSSIADDLQAANDELTSQNSVLEAQNGTLTDQISSINSELGTLSANLSQAVINLAAANATLTAANPELAAANTDLDAANAEVLSLQAELAIALNNADDGVSQDDLDAAIALFTSSSEVAQGTLDFLIGSNPLINKLDNSTFDDETGVTLDGLGVNAIEIDNGVVNFLGDQNGTGFLKISISDFEVGEYILCYQQTTTSGVLAAEIYEATFGPSLLSTEELIGASSANTVIYRFHKPAESGLNDGRVQFRSSYGDNEFVGTLDNVYLFRVPDNLDLSDDVISNMSGDYQSMQSQLVSSIIGFSNSASEGDLLSSYDAGFLAGVSSAAAADSEDVNYLFGYNDGAASVTPDDGVTQSDLDALQVLLDEALTEASLASFYQSSWESSQTDVFTLLGLLTDLTSSLEGFTETTLSDALDNLQLISMVEQNQIVQYNLEYNTSVSTLNELIIHIQQQASNLQAQDQQEDNITYDEYSFVLYGDLHSSFDFANNPDAKWVQLSWRNDNVSGYTSADSSNAGKSLTLLNGGSQASSSYGGTPASSIYGTCHSFDNGTVHAASGGSNPHDHVKIINSGQDDEATLKLSIKNFTSSSGVSTVNGPTMTEDSEFLDQAGNIIERGLHFTISVLSGNPDWVFSLYISDNASDNLYQDILGSDTLYKDLLTSSTDEIAGYTISDTNSLTNSTAVDSSSSGWAVLGDPNSWNFNSSSSNPQWEDTSDIPLFSDDILQKQPSLTLEAGKTYAVEFQAWGQFGDPLSPNPTSQGRILSLDLGDNSIAGGSAENTVIVPPYLGGEWNSSHLGYFPNTEIQEGYANNGNVYRVWGSSDGSPVQINGHGINTYRHRVYITTGLNYSANIVRFYGGTDSSGYGYTGWVRNIDVKEVTGVETITTTNNLKLLSQKTFTAEGRSRYSNPLYNRSRILNGSAKRMIKNKVTGVITEEPIVADGYKCIGVYEDKPKNRIYYFVENKFTNSKKYDCILEYDLITDTVETVYQDGRISSDGSSNNRILNFSDSHLITGVNKIDDILYWTDNRRVSGTFYNRPRKLNVELAKANEKNIENPRFVFKDAYVRSSTSTVYIGIGNNEHRLSPGDDIYAQLGLTSGAEATGINGYSRIIGIVRKPKLGTKFIVEEGSPTVTIPESGNPHGLEDYEGDWIGIEDFNNNNFPYYYQISTIVGYTITLTSPYNQATNSNGASPVRFGENLAAGIITDSPWPGSFTPVDGIILYADPYSDNRERILPAYSPLISFGTYEDKMKYFDVVKHQPTHKPSASIGTDSDFATNNILDNVFQFKYRYVHVDNEQTSYSPISDVVIDPIFALNAAVDAEDYAAIANKMVVNYNDSIGDVKDIEIVARKGNTGEFVLVDTVANNFVKYLKKAKNNYLPEYQYTDINSAINFYNNGTYPFVDKKDSDKLYDAVPKVAKAQTILSNNRIAYGNIIEGFDNTRIVANSEYNQGDTLTSASVSIQTSIESGQGSFASIQQSDENQPVELYNDDLGGSEGKTEHSQAFYLGGLDLSESGTQTVHINYSWSYSKNPDFFAVTQKRSGSFSSSAINVTGISTVNELGVFLAQTITSGVGSTSLQHQGSSCGHTTTATFNSNYDNTGAQLLIIKFKYEEKNSFSAATATASWGTPEANNQFNESIFLSGDGGLSSFKTGAFHNFGIAYFDETNRCSFVNTAPDYSNVTVVGGIPLNGTRPYNPFFTESAGPSLNTASQVSLNIYNQPPTWATSYQVYYTGNTTIDNDPDSDFPGFIQMMFVGAKVATDGNDKQIYLNMGALKGKDWSYNQANNSKLNYNYVAGDRIRFISFVHDNSRFKYAEYVDLEIAGMDLYLQNEEPPISVNSTTEGFYLRINDPGNTTTLFGDGNQDVNIAHTGFSYATSGYNQLIAEVYRPKKDLDEDLMVYYEIGDKIPILNAGFLTRRHGGSSSQSSDYTYNKEIGEYISDIPATINISNGDIYFKPRGMATEDDGSPQEVFFPEDYYLNDFHRTNHYSKGRINVVNNNAAERRLETTVYFSETYSSTGSVNGLSSFNPANSPYFDYNKSFGSIQSLQMRDNDLIIFHENKVGRVLVQKDILNTASGEGLVSLSTKVIGNYVNLYQGEYGCCYQPESIVNFGNVFYFIDIKKGTALRLSADGLTVISDQGMRDYFRDLGEMYVINDPEQSEVESFNIVAGYDPKYDEYIVTFPNVYPKRNESLWDGDVKSWDSSFDKYQNKTEEIIYNAQTLAFNERVNRWTSFYDFHSEYYGRVGRQFIGFKEGRLYRHNMTDRYYQDMYALTEDHYLNRINKKYNSFYGEQFDSHIEFPFNAEPSSVKSFNAISLEGDSKLFASMYTNIGQVIQGDKLKNGYKNTISTNIGYRKVDGSISNYQSETSGDNIIQGSGVNFFEEVKKGDLVRIFGVDKKGTYTFIHRIVISVISNTLISLNDSINITASNHHMEVLDYKTKEGVHYANIPFIESMVNPEENQLLGYSDYSEVGDGSEISGIGVVEQITTAAGTVLKEFKGVFNESANTIGGKIKPNDMIVGAEYVYFGADDNGGAFNINEVNNQVEYANSSPIGSVFVCQKATSTSVARVMSTDFKLYVRRQDNTVVFLGYPYYQSSTSVAFVKDLNYSQPDGQEAGGFLFVVKNGSVEGEKMKGQYMMTTLTTEHPGSAVLSKYKFNLYAANADVDKSELSNK